MPVSCSISEDREFVEGTSLVPRQYSISAEAQGSLLGVVVHTYGPSRRIVSHSKPAWATRKTCLRKMI